MGEVCNFGTHRVLSERKGIFPQAAEALDNTMEINNNEILVDVEYLKLDSASFNQIKQQSNANVEEMKQIISDIVAKRGKMHNPVTKSGGVFFGTVKEVGNEVITPPQIGSKIVSLVSLSLIPLKIHEIKEIKIESEEILISGEAILFNSSIYASYNNELPLNEFIATLDVAGAPARTREIVKEGDTVLIIGCGGKAGLLCLLEAKTKVKANGKTIALAYSQADYEIIERTNLADRIIQADATNPLEIYEKITEMDELADVTINCANVPRTEMASIISTKDKGLIYFFNMATDFTSAALGAEGIGKDVRMLIGNGYTENHVNIALKSTLKLKQLLSDKN
ncbi:L-erythro-3,5-diaminohexanoate dehydrogenase [Pseudogracilibacillus auburnensis]|uniref:L-erythro-3,5-diaminohexanoate dehydrogenase n=1 Tax=Pseudogracilibacillus auburnensis TaxID=1494959 RepID=UPI001A96ED1F|nr:L-erythro-3,5-diaminohexanoate dehydrogenase [Pseudogracilibacillus auburnensis]MBO1003199.1 L-erythro-3,5-diaminohexanoate dehydrogenase [Pseudogracilibacillus auburnensis]